MSRITTKPTEISTKTASGRNLEAGPDDDGDADEADRDRNPTREADPLAEEQRRRETTSASGVAFLKTAETLEVLVLPVGE